MYQSLRFLKNQSIFRPIHRYYGVRDQNYYEILGISQGATKKDIRLAFIKLSKETHPDKSNKDSEKSHADFVKINEAYNVLSKDSLRNQYDTAMKYGYNSNNFSTQTSSPYGTSEHMYTWYDATMHARGEKFKKHRHPNNLKPLKKSHIVMFCVLICLFGSSLQVWAFLKSPIFNRQALYEKSKKFGEEYDRVRIRAMMNKNTDDDHEEILTKLLENNANSEKNNDIKIVK